jgi:TatA/E family protein of Tat protein translocase
MLTSPLLLQGSEWMIVIAIIAAVLVFGPDKIPQLAKQVGRAKAEFDKASNEAKSMMDSAMKSIDTEATKGSSSLNSSLSEITNSLTASAREMKSSFDSAVAAGAASVPNPSPAAQATAAAQPAPTANEVDADALLKLAHKMGVETDGKTRDEISEAIFAKAGSPSPKPTESQA